jgi:hypothetical protein
VNRNSADWLSRRFGRSVARRAAIAIADTAVVSLEGSHDGVALWKCKRTRPHFRHSPHRTPANAVPPSQSARDLCPGLALPGTGPMRWPHETRGGSQALATCKPPADILPCGGRTPFLPRAVEAPTFLGQPDGS